MLIPKLAPTIAKGTDSIRMLKTSYDYIIVGGGSAGCAVANRLSVDPKTSVLVLEAGRPDYSWDVFIHMPAALSFPIGSKFYDWKYESEPEPFMGGRRIYHARGKLLGGSSSINGMIFQRGNPMDYDQWARDPGMKDWDYAHCLPYFKRMETCTAGADDYRGGDGPLVLERGPAENPLCKAFFAAVQQAGYSLTDDLNGFRQEGFARFDRNIERGRRHSASVAYLRPVTNRSNLTVVTRATATKIRFDGKRAIGLDYTRRGRSGSISAGEVILCGGSIGSPQLLQLSGVGNSAELSALGVRVVHELPGVGENLQDHLEVYIQHASKLPVSIAPGMTWWRPDRVVAFRARAGELDAASTLLLTVLQSIDVTYEWFAGYGYVSQLFQQRGRTVIQSAGEISTYLAGLSEAMRHSKCSTPPGRGRGSPSI